MIIGQTLQKKIILAMKISLINNSLLVDFLSVVEITNGNNDTNNFAELQISANRRIAILLVR